MLTTAQAQSVIFPQEQQAGTASVTAYALPSSEMYAIGNDLFSAGYAKADGVMRFAGCEALGLKGGTELFAIRFGNGAEVKASEMTLDDVRTADLNADAAAAKGSLKLPGKAIEARGRQCSEGCTNLRPLRPTRRQEPPRHHDYPRTKNFQ